ncbi:hypothetical protein [Nocardioides limicola]|uniref:hypothetical protein n=1 Tax=Nocardioides limicola TaxID=2803368 RepID=UPI00193BAC6C|nr:hypothetical protein [Nocardioides sp. DJM-14]
MSGFVACGIQFVRFGLAALIAVLLGLASPSAIVAPTHSPPVHVYEDDHGPALLMNTTSDRGPPATHDAHRTYDPADARLSGASARPDATAPGPTTTYTSPAEFAPGAQAMGTTRAPALVMDWSSVVTAGSRVAANGADDLACLTASQQKSLRSLQRQVETHRNKLDAFRKDPDAFDNLGHLQRAPTPEIRQRIIDGRTRHLEHEIRTFQDQIDKLRGGG